MEVKSQEEKFPKHIIVEVGPGHSPFPIGVDRRRIKKDEIYIGIEPYNERLKDTARWLKQKDIFGEGEGKMVKAKGQHLPFKDQSVQEVVICNLIGHPALSDQVNGFLPSETIKRIVMETGRVLKRGGKVTIVETYTPYPAPENLIKLFEESGLKVAKHLRLSAENEAERDKAKKELSGYTVQATLGNRSYLLEFEKR